MKSYLLLLGLMCTYAINAQVDTNYLKSVYDRCLDFSEEKTDSIEWYASFIEKESKRAGFVKGDVLSLRLKGYAQELKNNYKEAIAYYLRSLDAARKINGVAYEISALSDLATVYAAIKEPQLSKEVYLQCIELTRKEGKVTSVVTAYNNLAAAYNLLHQYDSALYFLNEAVRIGRPFPEKIDLSGTYNNIGNVYFRKRQFSQALIYFKHNYAIHAFTAEWNDLWIDHLNLADVYIELSRFDSASWHAGRALQLAQQLGSRSKEADSYSVLAKLYEFKNDYRRAYIALKKWYTLDTAIVNRDTYSTIAELQERFHARERDNENKLLQAHVAQDKASMQAVMIIAITLALIGILIAVAWITKRNVNRRLRATNELIVKQNEKLAELNHEKNTLISIVSHDLGAPLATINTWAELLQTEQRNLTAEQRKAVEKIITVSGYGIDLIHRVLDVEHGDEGNYKVELENFDIRILVEGIVDNFRSQAQQKGLQIQCEVRQPKIVHVISDKQLVSRICENLISNAIKYTPAGKNIWVCVCDEGDTVSIRIRDEGVGIAEEELPYLFSKYSKLSSRPTGGEASTGLGLSIVKRIVEELNGKIFCESEQGKGSIFTVILKK